MQNKFVKVKLYFTYCMYIYIYIFFFIDVQMRYKKDFRVALVTKFSFFVLVREFSGWPLSYRSTRSSNTRVCLASRETSG